MLYLVCCISTLYGLQVSQGVCRGFFCSEKHVASLCNRDTLIHWLLFKTSGRYFQSTQELLGTFKVARSSPALLQWTLGVPRSSLPFSCLLLFFERLLVKIHSFDVVVRHFLAFRQTYQKCPVCLSGLVIRIYCQRLVKGGQRFLSFTQK